MSKSKNKQNPKIKLLQERIEKLEFSSSIKDNLKVIELEGLLLDEFFLNDCVVVRKTFERFYPQGISIDDIIDKCCTEINIQENDDVRCYLDYYLYSRDFKKLVTNYILALEKEVHRYNLKLSM